MFPPGLPPRTPTSEVAFEIALDPAEVDMKRAALAAHASQTTGLAAAFGESAYREWYDHETFRRPRAEELT